MLKNIFYSTVFMAAALLLLAMLTVPHALALPSTVTFTVDNINDLIDTDTSDGVCTPGSCSLRAAIMQANKIPAPGATIIVPSGIYTLTRPPAGTDPDYNGDLNLTTPASGNPIISIIGAGAASTIIDANQIDRVLRIDSGRTVSISGVTIRNGYSPVSDGGGIWNNGSLTVSSSTISGNHAVRGGGIFDEHSLTVLNSIISQNMSDHAGGGLLSLGDLNVRNSTIGLNSAGGFGGGIYTGITLTLATSTIYGNHAGDGGGIFNDGYLTAVNSTIGQNNADTNGGGLYNRALTNGLAALYNTTIVDNDADHDRDENGGIGGGVYNPAGPRFIVVNTLIAGNTLVNSPIYDDCDGILEAYGKNLFSELSGCTIPNAGNAGLIFLNTIGPLQDNGGPTWTHALLAGSAAIDATLDVLGCVNETGALLTTDQRGAPRPVGVRCDVGA
ncbi:MAG TPA: choice-of-anchor Q domain-containing protein, partial [Anaerolineae bacterium]|nr:choice-of-anchor Q domain-containing protein [Anaerolineae bacterium]